jgi:hypothetical protein
MRRFFKQKREEKEIIPFLLVLVHVEELYGRLHQDSLK